LLLANSSTGEKSPKGIMGTKLFEYLAVEKPILCVRNDEGCLEEVINLANAGLAASTVKEVEKFILEKFTDWQKNGYTHQSVNQEFVQQFSRKRQAEQFADLFNKLVCTDLPQVCGDREKFV
jgi:glycosyltransferase involved in cell wall biosynthesis